MIDRVRLKQELDNLPDEALEQVEAFIRFQRFTKGLWKDETDYLSSIPGMAESIVAGMNTPVSECFDGLE